MHEAGIFTYLLVYYLIYSYLFTANMDFDDFDTPVQLLFDENTRIHSFTVNITDDICVENTEFFFSELNTSDSAVRLEPHQASITILDDDGMYMICT